MIKELRKYLKNKKLKANANYCEQMLGTNTAVHRFAQFWKDNHENMDVVFAALQHEWKMGTGFDSAQYLAFMEGLSMYEFFFQKCAEEVEKAQQLAERESPQA